MLFKSDKQKQLFLALRAELAARAGYHGELVAESYRFCDWFDPSLPERVAPVAFFGRTPPSYDNACFAILLANGRYGRDLVEDFRALGAPNAFEVGDGAVTQWSVAAERSEILPRREFGLSQIESVVAAHAEEWSPNSVLRAKNIFVALGAKQLDFIDLGLLPALESHVRDKLDRLLRETLRAAQAALGKRASGVRGAQQLFQLVFRFLAAKILHDRGVQGFSSLGLHEIDVVLERVAKHYGELPASFDDRGAKEAVASHLWQGVSLQNLSVEALAYIYENTLVDQLSRKELGTHSTPSSVARYIVQRLQFERIPEGERRTLEPCSGHGIFLVAALQRLRDLLPPEMDAAARHRYFVRMLQGYEIDSFAIEVSKLCLVLADFPNHNGWQLYAEDVFASERMTRGLRKARIVLANPPFEDFDAKARRRYKNLDSIHRPAELLMRVLKHAHADAVLGFVLPRQFVDGKGYRGLREELAKRYENMEVVSLPDGVFQNADQETALLIAQQPADSRRTSVHLNYGHVVEADREAFLTRRVLTRRNVVSRTIEELGESMALPILKELWDHLHDFPKLGDVADIHRGIEWQPPFDTEKYVSSTPKKGFQLGLWKVTRGFSGFVPAMTSYLSTIPADRRGGACEHPWHMPKVVTNAATLSRGMWRLAGFVDQGALICSQNFHGIWPRYDAWLDVIEAIVNGPIANAFVVAHEGKRHVRKRTLKAIPIPRAGGCQLSGIIEAVERLRRHLGMSGVERMAFSEWDAHARMLLLLVDAEVLKLYDLPPRLERNLLDSFHGEPRRVPFSFTSYYERDFTPQIPLWMLTSPDFVRCNGSYLRSTVPGITDPELVAALEEVE